MKFIKKFLMLVACLIACEIGMKTIEVQAAENNPISSIEVSVYVSPALIGSDTYFVKGSSLGYIAKVYCEDGTEVFGEDNAVTWELKNADGTDCKSQLVIGDTTYELDENHSYWPVSVKVAEDEDAAALVLTAKSVKNPEVVGTETRFTIDKNSGASLTVEQKGITWVYKTDAIDVGVAYEANNSGVEFRWLSYNLDTEKWEVIADWNKSNWATWKAEKGNYWLHCELRTADGKCTDQKTMCFAYVAGNTQISGTYAGYVNKNEILLGCNSYTGQIGETYSFKIYNLETESWTYLTDKNPAQWITWKAEKGNYWVHFELYTPDGRLADVRTYCFAVK